MIDYEIWEIGKEERITGSLYENTDYLLRFIHPLSDEQKAELQANYGSVLRSLSPPQLYMLNFGNFIGEASICGRTWWVESKKISWQQFDQMLQFITRKMVTLPYQASSPARIKVAENREEEAHFFHQWNLCRQALRFDGMGVDLVEAWRQIEHLPHHSLIKTTSVKHITQIKNVDERGLRYIGEHPEAWIELKPHHALAQTQLAERLKIQSKYYFPKEMIQEERTISYDTAENRMLKHILEEIHTLTLQMEQRLKQKRLFHHLSLERQNSQMQQMIEEWLGSHWLREVGALVYIPTSSTVLRSSRGYREWYAFYQQFLLGSSYPLPYEEIRAIVEGRDIAKLYEYWCFFTLVDVIEQQLGVESVQFQHEVDQDGFQRLKHGLKVSFQVNGQLLDVYYNKTFSYLAGSYSQTYRPDISLYWQNRWIHFDAKFRNSTTANKDDFDKMHTYKDAITHTQSAWILYPAESLQAFALFHPDYRDPSGKSGIGAIGILPDQIDSLVRVVNELLT